jgi:hypothetical protein
VFCADGSANPVASPSYDSYVDHLSDFLAASFLVGINFAIEADPTANPQLLALVLNDPQYIASLRSSIETSIPDTGLVAANSPQSTALLTDEITQRLLISIRNSANSQTVLGSPEQYNQVVQNFCAVPGTPVEQAQAAVPGLTRIQLYAICIQDSGLVTSEQVLQNRY